MNSLLIPFLLFLAADAEHLRPGNHTRSLQIGEETRTYLVHVPKSYDPKKATPVVLIYHGASMNADMMERYTGLSQKADQAGFIAVYPNGTGAGNLILTWNVAGLGQTRADDVAFTIKVLDDLGKVANIDSKRVYAAGLSNGAMMVYRLAAELPERIAAIAAVSGTMTGGEARPRRPVPVLHFHGTADTLVPFDGPNTKVLKFLKFCSVAQTVKTWAKFNGCPPEPARRDIPAQGKDPLKIHKETYGPGKDGAEVVLYVIEGGGHTWPGRPCHVPFLGPVTDSISANDLIWEFFRKHPRK